MYVSVHHTIKDPASFHTRGQQMTADLPPGVRPVQFFPNADGTKAVCLWESTSVDATRAHIDGVLGDASAQDYFSVAEDQALGLPATQAV